MKTKRQYETVRELEPRFVKTVDGFKDVEFTLLAKSGNAYFYHRRNKKHPVDDYEVIKRTVSRYAECVNGKWRVLEGQGFVNYPSVANFGRHGWSYNNTEKGFRRAVEKFNEISDVPFDECRTEFPAEVRTTPLKPES